MKTLFSILAFSLITLASFAQNESTNIEFFKGTFEEALAKAQAEDKLVFMDAYTVWCGPCKWMSKNTFTDPKVAEYFNENFVNVKMDMEKGEGPGLARKYRVRGYPTLLFLNGDGSIAKTQLGALPAEPFLALGKEVTAIEE